MCLLPSGAGLGCAGTEGASQPQATVPLVAAPAVAKLRVKILPEPSDLGREVVSALGAELARAGVSVPSDEHAAADMELRASLELRSLGVVVEGVTTLSAESNGVLVDRLITQLDVFRRDTFAHAVARELVDGWLRSPRVAAFAQARLAEHTPGARDAGVEASGAWQPPVVIPEAVERRRIDFDAGVPPRSPTGDAQPAATSVPITPASPAANRVSASSAKAESSGASDADGIGKAGRFGIGVSLEAYVGWNQVFATGASPSGAVAALALQFDLGPRAAFRLPVSLAFAGGGTDEFGQLAVAPSVIYRFRNHRDQTLIPYLGLGLRVGDVVGGRHLLGRPVTGVAGPDACPRRNSLGGTSKDPDHDCSFYVSPEPQVGIEWHSSELFSLDIAANYSFAHFSSSEGLARWVSLFQLYLGPRVSF